MKIWTEETVLEINGNRVYDLEKAMRFKARHPKAKADPELFEYVADILEDYQSNRTMFYKDFMALVHVDTKRRVLVGVVPDCDDDISFEADTVEHLYDAFRNAIDAYLNMED